LPLQSLFGNNISVIFFDATTIYFESFTVDSLKKNGWSKDKKTGQPQVLFALMVTEDGLLGVITNDKDSSPSKILSHYHNLYVVEDAFRLTKHDLAVGPVFHWKPSRVSAHIAICFCAYSLVKYLEYRVRLQYTKLSPEKIRQTLGACPRFPFKNPHKIIISHIILKT